MCLLLFLCSLFMDRSRRWPFSWMVSSFVPRSNSPSFEQKILSRFATNLRRKRRNGSMRKKKRKRSDVRRRKQLLLLLTIRITNHRLPELPFQRIESFDLMEKMAVLRLLQLPCVFERKSPLHTQIQIPRL